jgi:hypothetical protein
LSTLPASCGPFELWSFTLAAGERRTSDAHDACRNPRERDAEFPLTVFDPA